MLYKHILVFLYVLINRALFTFEDGCKPPACHGSAAGELADGRLHVEKRHADGAHHDGKRDEEGPAAVSDQI